MRGLDEVAFQDTDSGRPELPLDWLKAEWKAHGPLKTVHLSVSGCLGPCEWAQDTARTASPAPVPQRLEDRCFERWQAKSA